VITVVVLLYCVFNGTKILNIFNPEGEGVVKSYQGGKKKELEAVLTGEDRTHKNVSLSNVTTTQPAASASVNQGDGSDSSGSTVVQESGTIHERVFFHILMIFVSYLSSKLPLYQGFHRYCFIGLCIRRDDSDELGSNQRCTREHE
jgi:hypothetical protein